MAAMDDAYLVGHRIPHLLNDMVLDLVRDKPEDVARYSHAWLRGKAPKRIRVGINGFGRIGRMVLQAICEQGLLGK